MTVRVASDFQDHHIPPVKWSPFLQDTIHDFEITDLFIVLGQRYLKHGFPFIQRLDSEIAFNRFPQQ
ncbi:hypothetical protein [Anaerotruncus colihominis]|uniref:hypothetical protein n=1 Tax=Anaerotruncus colihominis TaxID=169435 RepID=UPI0013A66A0B|nr:hypothetical protein [Anaerotruncus colihominis]